MKRFVFPLSYMDKADSIPRITSFDVVAERAGWRESRDPTVLRRQLMAIVGEFDRLGRR